MICQYNIFNYPDFYIKSSILNASEKLLKLKLNYLHLNMQIANINKFASLAGLIKKVKRTGWLRYLPSEKVESVGDHSAKIAMLAIYLRNMENVNYSKCVEMALIHDIA